ncbi:hypothetical protein KC19_VG219100 [Ceratodon purpureus]|uniref:Uncharacterized protein n=1 Tax=Ceratodon purpureus TaxID=3225 RepID=A0A8T0HSF3_CERPU|nr:hypothetical protein KC19_VG219100 [Ceratodon purpureus]
MGGCRPLLLLLHWLVPHSVHAVPTACLGSSCVQRHEHCVRRHREIGQMMGQHGLCLRAL